MWFLCIVFLVAAVQDQGVEKDTLLQSRKVMSWHDDLETASQQDSKKVPSDDQDFPETDGILEPVDEIKSVQEIANTSYLQEDSVWSHGIDARDLAEKLASNDGLGLEEALRFGAGAHPGLINQKKFSICDMPQAYKKGVCHFRHGIEGADFEADSVAKCCEACQANPKCKAWNYYPSSNWCYPQFEVGKPWEYHSCISGEASRAPVWG